jgi:hypothetical protein
LLRIENFPEIFEAEKIENVFRNIFAGIFFQKENIFEVGPEFFTEIFLNNIIRTFCDEKKLRKKNSDRSLELTMIYFVIGTFTIDMVRLNFVQSYRKKTEFHWIKHKMKMLSMRKQIVDK